MIAPETRDGRGTRHGQPASAREPAYSRTQTHRAACHPTPVMRCSPLPARTTRRSTGTAPHRTAPRRAHSKAANNKARAELFPPRARRVASAPRSPLSALARRITTLQPRETSVRAIRPHNALRRSSLINHARVCGLREVAGRWPDAGRPPTATAGPPAGSRTAATPA